MSRLSGLAFLLIFLSCSRHQMTEDDLKDYIANEENGLHKRVVKDGISIEAFYKPSQMVWKSDIQNEADVSKKEVVIQACDTLTYFSFHFSRNDKELENAYVSNPTVFNSVINYLSFDIVNDFYMIIHHDTIPAISAVYSRTFGAGTSTIVMAAFDEDIKDGRKGEVKVCFNDKMFETGLNELVFNIDDIKNTPTLIFN